MKDFFPELDFILSKFDNEIFFYEPENYIFGNTSSEELNTSNIFRIIFDDNVMSVNVHYSFEEVDDINTLPPDIKSRCSVIHSKRIFMATDNNTTITNYFGFTNEDVNLFTKMKLFKNTSVCQLNLIDYNQLSEIGKNVYHLLNYMCNKNNITDITQLNESSLLSTLVKIYLLELNLKDLTKESKTFLIKDEIIK